MHPNFPDWYKHLTFGNKPETVELRWKGIETVLGVIDGPMTLELVRLVYGRPLTSTEFESTFRQYFKDADALFLASGNDPEVKTLAGCVLAMTCVDNYDVSPLSALAIITAAACGQRNLKIEIDLPGMAAHWILSDGMRARKKIRALALKPIGAEATTQLEDVRNDIDEQIKAMQAFLDIQDEELRLLWWIIGGKSHKWDSNFTGIDSKARAVLLAEEASEMTISLSEPPSLKAIFSRVNVNEDDKFTIQESVNACGKKFLNRVANTGQVCPSIYPVHFAMSRAVEVNSSSTWVGPWSQAAGIGKTARISALDLAMQVYRERQLMNSIERAK